MRQYGDMRNESSPATTFSQQLIRMGGMVLVVLLGVWLALRVVAGVISTIIWLATTALLVAVVVGVLWFAFGHRRPASRRDDDF